MKDAPPITEQLLNYLDKKFPERCADPKDSEREIWMKSGERRVYQHFKAVYNFQNKKDNILQKA